MAAALWGTFDACLRRMVLPAESSEEFKSLARRLGYRERDRSKGAALLAGDIRQTMAKVHQYFVSRFDKGK